MYTLTIPSCGLAILINFFAPTVAQEPVGGTFSMTKEGSKNGANRNAVTLIMLDVTCTHTSDDRSGLVRARVHFGRALVLLQPK